MTDPTPPPSTPEIPEPLARLLSDAGLTHPGALFAIAAALSRAREEEREFAIEENERRAVTCEERAATYDCRKPDEDEAQHAYNEAAKQIRWANDRIRARGHDVAASAPASDEQKKEVK